MNTPTLALVESNTTGSGRQFCAAARARGFRPVVLAAAPERYPYIAEDRVAHVVVDTHDIGSVLDACARLSELAGVTSSSEYFIATAAEVAEKLSLPTADLAAVVRCRQKERQRAVLAESGVPVPPCQPVGKIADCVRAADMLGYPVVVKPASGTGSVGVRRCDDAAAVAAHATRLLTPGTDERDRPLPGLVLVERYVTGPEFSVETFDDTAVAIVAKHLGREPYFVETGHDVPAPVPADVAAALAQTARTAVAALGLGWGAAHTELRLSPQGPVVIEVNPRLAGGMIPTLVHLATGVDLVDAVVVRAVGQRPAVSPRPLGHASIRFVVADAPGTVTAVGGLDAARAMSGVHLAGAAVCVGSTIAVTHSFRDRVGYVIGVGRDAVTAGDIARRGAAHVYVETRELAIVLRETLGQNALAVRLEPGRPPVVAAADVGDCGGPECWAAIHRDEVRAVVAEHGAVLVRGLGLRDPTEVGRIARQLTRRLTVECEGFAARTAYEEGVYSSAAWPSDQPMCMHHEQSYATRFPGLLIFGCLIASEDGGVVGLADAEAVLQALPGELVARFDRVGWQLTRNYHEGLGVPWTEVFDTEDRGVVEQRSRNHAVEAEWIDGGVLRTRQRRFAVVEHPLTGRRCWFNQIAFLNEWTMAPDVREYLAAVFGPNGLPFNTAFGDGEPISEEMVQLINDVYDSYTVSEPWRNGDLLVVDNVRTAHSRTPFHGPRDVVVAMGDPVDVGPFSEARSRRLRWAPVAPDEVR